MITPMAIANPGISTIAPSCCISSAAWCGWKPRRVIGLCRRGRGVWAARPGTPHTLRVTGVAAARTLFIDPLARADLPSSCQIVQVTPLLRELIVASLTLAESYAPGSRDERIYELILDEIRGMAVLPFGLPEPQSEALRRLCQKVREAPANPGAAPRRRRRAA